ncbi:MAG: 3-hexulose-6-phosphate synthase [Gammaproteobacteria bacterium]|nr:MAG: 3-hexulose-6-phosphate synthase [Gammaproteobacteria bacterium]
MAEIQMALDSLDFDATMALAEAVAPYVDILEIGTPCIKYNGLKLVKALKAAHPTKKILVDLKTMDAGEYESTPFFEAGGNICTVLGAADTATVNGVIKAAKANNAEAQIDLISVEDKAAVAKEAVANGAQIIGVHTGLDAQAAGQTPFADLALIAGLGLDVKISVAGGINKDTIQSTVQAGATIVVVGAAIYGADSPADSAKELRALVDAA